MKKAISMLAEGKIGKIEIIDQIGKNFWGEGYSAKDFAADLQALGDVDELHVDINSMGGSVVDGAYIYTALSAHPAQVHINIAGYAFSMASAIAMAGDHVKMSEVGLYMVHKPLTFLMDPLNADELRAEADVLDKFEAGLMKTYMARTDLSEDEVTDLLRAETFMSAEEALELGFIDEIIPAKGNVAAVLASIDPEWAAQAGDERHAPLLEQFIAKKEEQDAGDKISMLDRILGKRTQAKFDAMQDKVVAAEARVGEVQAAADEAIGQRDALQATVDGIDARLSQAIADERERITTITAHANELGVDCADLILEGIGAKDASAKMLAMKAQLDDATSSIPKISDGDVPVGKAPLNVGHIYAARKAAKRNK